MHVVISGGGGGGGGGEGRGNNTIIWWWIFTFLGRGEGGRGEFQGHFTLNETLTWNLRFRGFPSVPFLPFNLSISLATWASMSWIPASSLSVSLSSGDDRCSGPYSLSAYYILYKDYHTNDLYQSSCLLYYDIGNDEIVPIMCGFLNAQEGEKISVCWIPWQGDLIRP